MMETFIAKMKTVHVHQWAMLQIIPANTIIPTQITKTAYITGSELSIRQGNYAIATQNQVITTLHFNSTGMSQKRQVKITISIDANYDCRINAKDTYTNEIVDTIIK